MDKIIFWAILIVFPLGQITKFGFVNLIDILVCLLSIITIFKKPKYPEWFKYFLYFIFFCLFSLLLNYKFVELKSILYLVRLFAYSYLAIYISNFYKDKIIIKYLLILSLVSAVFGWLQYLVKPDMRFLYDFGWDDHLNRMIGTFFDPAYLGLIVVLGIIIAVELKYKKILYFLLFSLAFTYSRSSYSIAGLFLIFKQKYLALLTLIIVILFLPKNIGEGTNLARTVSGNNKVENYAETIGIISQSPLYGIGFNNICYVKGGIDNNLHSCNGADSSILFILATTGIVGLILFINFIFHVPKFTMLSSSFLIVLIHSMFTNSLFYPHIMFWMFTLLGLQGEFNQKRNL